MSRLVGNSRFQKEANSYLILNLIQKNPLSRTEIASELGLQPSTVTYSVARLLDLGIIKEGDVQPSYSNAGRKRYAIQINSSFGRVAGAEIDGNKFRLVICDTCGSVVKSKVCMFSKLDSGSPAARFQSEVNQIVAEVTRLCSGFRILGVGISVAGVIGQNGKSIRECWSQSLWNADFSDFLGSFHFPVKLENDARLCAGKFMSDKSLAYVLVKDSEIGGVAVGVGLVLGGRIYRGDCGRSGEYHASDMMYSGLFGKMQVNEKADDRSIAKSILSDAFSLVSVLDVSKLYLNFPPRFKELCTSLLSNELAASSIALSNRICSDVCEWDSAEGGARMMISEYLAVPQIGSVPRTWGLFAEMKKEA